MGLCLRQYALCGNAPSNKLIYINLHWDRLRNLLGARRQASHVMRPADSQWGGNEQWRFIMATVSLLPLA
jgi:hypothetical protein